MKLQRKSRVVILLLMLAFNLAAITLKVQADAGGTGKFLTIVIKGEGYVTATKVNSGAVFEFYKTIPPTAHKVGAGTVRLQAFHAIGWTFSHWEGDLTGDTEPVDFKTEKYANITAVFVKETYTIVASVEGDGEIDPGPGPVIVEYGASQTFYFTPYPNNHISAIVVDGNSSNFYAENYTFTAVTEDHTIHVAFSEEGTVSVPGGPGGNYFADQYLFIEIGEVEEGGVILGSSLLELVPEGAVVGLYLVEWETAGAPTFEGGVVLWLLIPAGTIPSTVRVIYGDSWQAILCDVNNDLVVDSTDTSIVAEGKNQLYDPRLDLNNDGEITNADRDIVNENKGATLEDVTGSVEPGPDGLYFVTTETLEENAFYMWH